MILTRRINSVLRTNYIGQWHALLCTKTLNNNNIGHYDIIISGGGLVGTTLACSLSKCDRLSEKKILLLEGGPKFKRKNIEGIFFNTHTFNTFFP